MTTQEIIQHRLHNQKLIRSDLQKPEDVVSWLGAMQAQDYPSAKWAIGLRSNAIADADVEEAFNRGAIVRTHILRPTWHFVAPVDIRWMLNVSAPRVHSLNAYYYRKLEIDGALVKRSRRLLERALRDGKTQTRAELAAMFEQAGIKADGLRLAYLVMHAELDAVICSGPRRGNQFTYTLLEERVARAPNLDRNEALGELTRRYFSSRGPATIRDFVWWSGLTVRETKIGLEVVKTELEEQKIDGRSYWLAQPGKSPRSAPSSLHLLPNYDEFGIAYKDRDVAPAISRPSRLTAAQEFAHLLLINGQFVGRWKRTVSPDEVLIEVQPFRPLNRTEKRALAAMAKRYGCYIDCPACRIEST